MKKSEITRQDIMDDTNIQVRNTERIGSTNALDQLKKCDERIKRAITMGRLVHHDHFLRVSSPIYTKRLLGMC
jgi:hypothetical protein